MHARSFHRVLGDSHFSKTSTPSLQSPEPSLKDIIMELYWTRKKGFACSDGSGVYIWCSRVGRGQ